jgi:hypothetical protein
VGKSESYIAVKFPKVKKVLLMANLPSKLLLQTLKVSLDSILQSIVLVFLEFGIALNLLQSGRKI